MLKENNKEQVKLKFWKRFKIYLCITASILVVLLSTLIILLTKRFKDNNRSTYKYRDVAYTEIIKKNYIEGFENSKNTGKFSYVLPNEDINELLAFGTKSLSDKHIKSIYFDSDSQGYRYFFIDLTKVGVKTRVVFTTAPSIKDESTIKLSIASISMGKVNAEPILQKKGYLTSEFINPYFKACHLPITFDKASMSFEVKPYKWISSFPTSEIADEIFTESKSIEGAYSFNYNVFGFDLDLSKYSSGREYVNADTTNVPNIYEEVKNGCLTNFPSMSIDETKIIYSLSEQCLNKHIKSSFASEYNSEISSSITDKKASFEFIGANIHFDHIDKITMTLFFLINGYVISKDTSLNLNLSSSVYYGAYFTKESTLSDTLDKCLTNILSCLSSTYTYFDYTASEMLHLNLEALNTDTDLEPDIWYAQKAIEINPSTKTLDFKITK